MELKQHYQIEIFDVSTSGEGIGRVEGVVTFVPGLIPGDVATVEITEVKKNLAKGKIVSIDNPSADRCEAPCPYFEKCGGCTLQNMSYEAQLRLKDKQLKDKLDRIYGGEAPEIEPIIGMDDPWHYRNKGVFSVYAGKAIVNKDGSVRNAERPRVGFFDGKGRNIVEAKECLIQSGPAMAAAEALREYIKQTGFTIYDEKTKKGRLRQMIVRSGFESREVMVVLVVNGKKVPKPELLADLMFSAIDTLNDEVEARYNETGVPEEWYELKSLIINHNSNRNLGEISTATEVIYGAPVIKDWAAGLEFEISALSFYQVNPVQMDKLYATVLEFADLKGDETVFDLYCGVGTIGLYCASKAKYVWGIESVKSAVIDANRNAVINGLVNIQFINGKAEEKIFELEEKEIIPDLVIMDPPRAGCKPELLEAVLKASPEKIVYVSCDAGTLTRDLKILAGEDSVYKINRIRQVDQFCHSTHTETVVLLTKK
ncbi:MAG: 23S rRNA (uracil(1939)-C(5))-methyltransferase RlmD [Firmicutes bacterium]|nr:23S rRNA (uracil(1939)-C(5))-methyltransferase RlmD [Bacillota bacterium]